MKLVKLLLILFCAFSFTISCSGGSTVVDDGEANRGKGGGNGSGGNTEITEAPGYPDDYSQWKAFVYRDRWGPYNVHDPSCMDDGEWTYCFSTDVMYGIELQQAGIQVRRSKDLVTWEFVGWAFSGIPKEAYDYVTKANEGTSPGGIWAPYITKHEGTYRLYYSVSVFGSDASFIGLATSSSLEGPWIQQGAVLTSSKNDPVNAIDPAVIKDQDTGEQWMAYGSFFAGLYITQLDPETGKPLKNNDQGKRIALNESGALEGPEIIYHQPTGTYYLFVAYGSLFDIYNTRVGRSDNPDGPFLDYFVRDMSEATDNYPLLTAPYQFDNHSGWQGVSHVGVFTKGDQYFMMHQGRPGFDPSLMVMHLRKLTWTSDGWPVASPQRYGGVEQQEITADSVVTGEWEQISLESVQSPAAKNHSKIVEYLSDGKIAGESATWKLQDKTLIISENGETIEFYLSHGYDWENRNPTIVYTGLNSEGKSVWGKKIE